MTKSQNLPFVTYDKALASALLEKGFKLQSCRHLRAGKSYFTFHGAESLRQAVELYWNDKFPLNARGILNKYQEVVKRSNDQKR